MWGNCSLQQGHPHQACGVHAGNDTRLRLRRWQHCSRQSSKAAVGSAQSTRLPSARDAVPSGTTSGHTTSQPDQVPVRTPSRSTRDYTLVAESTELIAMLEELRSATCIALDCEGVKLGDRQSGKLTLMQLSARLVSGGRTTLRIWVVDVLALQWRTFQYHTTDRAVSLKKILEDDKVAKLMYDVRSDSSQLRHEFSIRLRAAYDLQLAEVAVRQLQMVPTAFVLPLDKALTTFITRTPAFDQDMAASYEIARAYHYSNKTEVWEQRPLSAELLNYASSDVRYLHQLADALNKKLPSTIIDKVKQASSSRMAMPVAADKRRAEAPVIVRRSDVFRLVNTNTRQQQQQPTAPNNTTLTDTAQPGSHAATADDRQAQAHRPQQNGTGPAGGAQAEEDGSQSSPEPAPSPPTRREAPRRLLLRQQGARPQPAAEQDSAALGGGSEAAPEPAQDMAAPFLLQPRKRAEGEVAPTWIYDSLKPRAPQEPTGEGAAGMEGSEALQHDESDVQPEDGVAGEQEQPQVPSKSPSESLLLWSPGAAQQGGSAKETRPELKRPTLQRPPVR